jgi:transposase
MKVNHHPHPHQVYVLAIGARRRLQALRASGYSIPEIAEHTESSGDSLYSSTRRPTITLRRWLEVRQVYALLSATPGKNTKAARMAAEKGWPLPMEWEGYDIDDPRVTPKETRRKGGDTARARRVELVERVQELTERGETAKRIAERLGVHERTVVRYRSEVAA